MQNRSRTAPRRDLTWLDPEPILRQRRAECELLAAEIAALNAEIEGYEVDARAYAHWFEANFGARVSRVRELLERSQALEELLGNVRRMVDLTDCSERDAYRQVVAIQAGKVKIEQLKAEGAKSFGAVPPPEIVALLEVVFAFEFDDEEISPREYPGIYAKFVKDFESKTFKRPRAKKYRKTSSRDEEPGSYETFAPRAAPPPPKANSDCRRVYHQLARKLHPDLNPRRSPAEAERWHEVQEAFEERDTERLEYLASLEEGEPSSRAGGFAGIRSLARFREIFVKFRQDIRTRQSTLRELRKADAWNFRALLANPAKLRAKFREHDRGLSEDELGLSDKVEQIEEMVQRWQATGKRRKKRRDDFYEESYP